MKPSDGLTQLYTITRRIDFYFTMQIPFCHEKYKYSIQVSELWKDQGKRKKSRIYIYSNLVIYIYITMSYILLWVIYIYILLWAKLLWAKDILKLRRKKDCSNLENKTMKNQQCFKQCHKNNNHPHQFIQSLAINCWLIHELIFSSFVNSSLSPLKFRKILSSSVARS